MPGNFQYSGDLEVRMGANGKQGGVLAELTISDDMITTEGISYYKPNKGGKKR